MKKSEFVKINEEKLLEVSEWISQEKYDLYDESSNHPEPNELSLEESLRFIFIVDTLNFCFWPYKMEYENLTKFIKDNIKNKKFDPEFFVNLKFDEFQGIFKNLFKE